MTPMSDGETRILSKLADVAQQQAVNGERLTALVERLEDKLELIDEATEAAVEKLQGHITSVVGRSDTWWRRAFFIAIAALSLSNITGAAIPTLIGLLHLKP